MYNSIIAREGERTKKKSPVSQGSVEPYRPNGAACGATLYHSSMTSTILAQRSAFSYPGFSGYPNTQLLDPRVLDRKFQENTLEGFQSLASPHCCRQIVRVCSDVLEFLTLFCGSISYSHNSQQRQHKRLICTRFYKCNRFQFSSYLLSFQSIRYSSSLGSYLSTQW